MKKVKKVVKRKAHKVKVAVPTSFSAWAVRGILHDVIFGINIVAKVGGYPVRGLAHLIHLEARKYPELKFIHDKRFIGAGIGFAVLVVAFVFEHAFHHPAWEATIEVAKAGGACPVWEGVAALVKVGEEI